METAAQKVRDWWEVADRTQRYVTIFGLSALVLLLVLTAFVMSRPKMTAIYSGLTPTQQGDIVAALRAEGIPVELGERGAVMVPSNRAVEAEAAVARSGVAPSSGPQGFELLSKSSFGQTSAQERETIIAAKEGELAKTIMTWQGVSAAKVHWNVGDDSPFANETTPGSASINIVESGAGLSGSAGKAIARLVQNATDVEPEHITVTNNFGRILYDGSVLNQNGMGEGQKLAAEIQEARRREADLTRSLDAAFGPGNTIAMVQVELDMDTETWQETKLTPSDVPTEKVTVSEDLNGGSVPSVGGAAGFDPSNNPGAQPTTNNTSEERAGSYSSSQSSERRPTDTRVTHTNKAQGEVIGMTVQVLANTKNVKNVKAVEEITNAYLGAKFGLTGFSAKVTAVEFDEKAAKAAQELAKGAASGAKMQQLISLLPVLALVVVGFLVIKAITKVAANRAPTMSALTATGMALPMQAQLTQGQQPQRQAGATASPSFIQYDPSAMEEPMTAANAGSRLEKALGSGQIDAALRIIEEMPEDPEIKAIQARINVPLEQIKHMAKTKPQSVAMLLKGWMMEDMR
ncbi:MAG: flagellar M-ring protein FliF C-terminal domain-containing protein [Fimbriimonadaceae bacterium]